MTTPLSWLLRCPTYKDQINQLKDKNITTYGFLGYPCLQAADILIYKAGFVPVGEDQLPHLELTRELQEDLIICLARYPWAAGNFDQGKSIARNRRQKDEQKLWQYHSSVRQSRYIRKKVSSMITDPARIRKDDPGHPEVCTVFSFHKVFNENEVPEIEQHCRGGKLGVCNVKRTLLTKWWSIGAHIWKRQKIVENPSIVKEILADGNEKPERLRKRLLKKYEKPWK